MRRLTLVALLAAVASGSSPAAAQRAEPVFTRNVKEPIAGPPLARSDAPGAAVRPAWPAAAARVDTTPHRRRSSAWAALASAVVPGTGQLLLRQRRAVVYIALEALALSRYASHSRDARRSRDAYRSLAATVARAPFSETRPVGDFDYYERMEHYVASGRFDLSSQGLPIRPEEDTTTFNGAIWQLARRTYWNDPSQPPPRESIEWLRAESFYLQRAIRPEYRWSWEGAEDAHGNFRQLIGRSNDRYRDALSDLGWTLGNHVLSSIDASVSIRLRRQETMLGTAYGATVSLPW